MDKNEGGDEDEDEDEVVLSGSVLLGPELHNCWLEEVGGQHALHHRPS